MYLKLGGGGRFGSCSDWGGINELPTGFWW